MHVVVLVLTIFLYGQDAAVTQAFVMPSVDDCRQAASAAEDQVRLKPGVRDVSVKCMVISGQDRS